MDDMLHQVLAMAEQTTDVVESLTMLATALAIDEQCSMNEANLCRLTEKGVRATSAAVLTDADALTLAARAIAIFLEKQAAHHLQIQFTPLLGKQLSVILRHMPRSVLVSGAAPSSYAGAASAPPSGNANANAKGNNKSGAAVATAGLRFSTLTPVDFIEEVLRILRVYGVFKKSFAAVADMPSDAVLLHGCLEWLPHVNRRVFPELAAFCCSRIVACSALALNSGGAGTGSFHPYRLDRSADLFLNRILKDEITASFQQEIIRVECLFKIGVCFATRAAVVVANHNNNNGGSASNNNAGGGVGGFFGGLFGTTTTTPAPSSKNTTVAGTKNTSATHQNNTTPLSGLLINADFTEKMLKVVVDHLTQSSSNGGNNNNNNSNQTAGAVLTLALRFLAAIAYNNQILFTALTTSSTFSNLLLQLLQIGLTSKAIQESNSNNNNNDDDALSDGSSPTIDANNTLARNDTENSTSNHFNTKKKLQLPTLFATTAAATAAARLAAAVNTNQNGAGAGVGGRTNTKEFNGGVNDDVTLVLTILSMIVGSSTPATTTTPSTCSVPRIEPQLRWTWSSGEAEVDYTGDSCLTLTRALFAIGTNNNNSHRGLMVVPLHTPGGRFNMSFEYMAQLNAENKRPRGVSCSYLPDKLGVRGASTAVSIQQLQLRAAAGGAGDDDDGGAAVAAAYGGASGSGQPQVVPPQVVDFLKSLFSFAPESSSSSSSSAKNNLLNIMMNELWSLRSGDYKTVVEGVFLRLLQLGVWKELPMPVINNNNNNLLANDDSASAYSSIPITDPALLFFGSVLVELLQNSSFAAATVECVQKDILQTLVSNNNTNNNNNNNNTKKKEEFDKWASFLRSSGFSDILAASVQLPKETNQHGGDEDDDDHQETEAPLPAKQQDTNNNNNNSKRKNKNNAKGTDGKANPTAEIADASMPTIPIDPKIAAKLLSMIGDCIESTSHHTIAQIMKRVSELISSTTPLAVVAQQSNNNNNNTSPSRELRTLLSEFTKIVRSSRGQPRKLLKEITDTGVSPRHFAAFIASDTSLAKTLCRIAAASCFGAQPGARPTPAQANSSLSTCATNHVKLFTSAATTCCDGHAGCLGPNSGSGSGAATCYACKSAASRANTMFRCSACNKLFCPSCVCGTASGSGTGAGSNTTSTAVSLIGCVGDWLRHIGTTSSNNANASVASLCLTKSAKALLANSLTIPLSTPIAALVTVMTSNNNNRASGATADIASIFGKRKVNQVLSQRKQHPDINFQISIVSENRNNHDDPNAADSSIDVFVREPDDHHNRQARDSTNTTTPVNNNNHNNNDRRRNNNNNNVTTSAPTANHTNTSVDNLTISATSPSSSFGAQDVLHLQFLQGVCPNTLAETFTEELGAWLQASALDVCLAGMIGLHKKIHDCLPALKLAVPLAVRFELWRYTTIGGRRRALATLVEREMGTGGSVDLELTTRQVMEKFAIGVDRSSSSISATTTTSNNNNNAAAKNANANTTSNSNNNNNALLSHLNHNLSKFLIAPIHRRLDLYFKDEVGRGEGPTQEVYSEVARQVSANPKLWVDDGKTFGDATFVNNNNNNNADDADASTTTTHASSTTTSFQVSGYIPAAGTEQEMYTLGVICGRALLDGYVVNVPFHELVFTFLTCTTSSQQQTAVRNTMLSQVIDPNFYKNVMKLADMKSNAELEATGLEYDEPVAAATTSSSKPSTKKAAPTTKSVPLSTKNVHKYIEQTLAERFEPIKASLEQFGRGVQRVVDFNFLKACFENHELPFVLGGISARPGGSAPLFTASELNSCIVPVHGYNHQSVQIQWLKDALLSFAPDVQSDFVEFLTGSRGLPAGGITNLSSVITVGKKQFDEGDTNAKQGTLASCSTCFLYLKLPPYTSFETFCARLLVAIREGRRNFSHT